MKLQTPKPRYLSNKLNKRWQHKLD